MPVSLSLMFQSVGLFYGLLLPVAVVSLFCLFLLVGLSRGGARVEDVTLAIYCYLAQSLGIMLMTAGGLPALHSVFAGATLSSATYLGLVLTFAFGGILFLWHDSKLVRLNELAKSVPHAVFLYSWKFIGLLITMFSALSFILRLLFYFEGGNADWWVMHTVMLIYGLLLSWFTLEPAGRPLPFVRSVGTVAMQSTSPKKAVAKKKKK